MNLTAPIFQHARGESRGAEVTRRKLFCIAGFDPKGPRCWRERARREGAWQGALSGYRLDIEGDPDNSNRWWMHWSGQGPAVATEVSFLGWQDIVRDHMVSGFFQTCLHAIRAFCTYAYSGALGAMYRLRPQPVIAGLLLCLGLILIVLAALVTGVGTVLGLQALMSDLPVWSMLAVGGLTGWVVLRLAWMLDRRLMLSYLISDFAYAASRRGGFPPDLDARLDAFAGQVAAALADPIWDEVLVVGHSTGAHLAVSVLDRALGARPGREACPRVALLTLGHSVPMMSFLPEATALRASLSRLADRRDLTWVDVTAPGDAACFALSDPAATCRAAGRPPGTPNPLVISAAFSRTVGAGVSRRRRRSFVHRHFQYLCHFERPGEYDHFLVTAGPMTLASRYAGRRSSPSMIAMPFSPVLHPG